MKPTSTEIEEVFKEEHEAALAFADILSKETTVQLQKVAARKRLSDAREAKRQIMAELMAV